MSVLLLATPELALEHADRVLLLALALAAIAALVVLVSLFVPWLLPWLLGWRRHIPKTLVWMIGINISALLVWEALGTGDVGFNFYIGAGAPVAVLGICALLTTRKRKEE